MVGYSDDEDETQSYNSRVLDEITEAEEIHCAECQSLHDEYRMVVSSVIEHEPTMSELAYQTHRNFMLLPLNEVARDELITIQRCEFFFITGLEQLVGRGLRAALAEL